MVCESRQAGTTARLCRSGVKGEGGRAATALAHPPTNPIPHALPGMGYICGLWVLLGQYNSQSKGANADCAQFIFPSFYSFLYSTVIYNFVGTTNIWTLRH